MKWTHRLSGRGAIEAARGETARFERVEAVDVSHALSLLVAMQKMESPTSNSIRTMHR
jgi:hypothetical protein